ncbi:MAG: hypothetical protein QXL43_01365 [Methanolinea sp.]
MQNRESPGDLCSETGIAECIPLRPGGIARVAARYCPVREKYCFTTCEFCRKPCRCPLAGGTDER